MDLDGELIESLKEFHDLYYAVFPQAGEAVKTIKRLIKERDEARAKLTEARRELEELDFLRYEGGEESIGREIEKTEQRGYGRGIQDAAKVAEQYLGPDSYCELAIRALLDKPSQA
jgi:hypothetical protein